MDSINALMSFIIRPLIALIALGYHIFYQSFFIKFMFSTVYIWNSYLSCIQTCLSKKEKTSFQNLFKKFHPSEFFASFCCQQYGSNS